MKISADCQFLIGKKSSISKDVFGCFVFCALNDGVSLTFQVTYHCVEALPTLRYILGAPVHVEVFTARGDPQVPMVITLQPADKVPD